MHAFRNTLPAALLALAPIISCGTSSDARRARGDEPSAAREEAPTCAGERGADRCLRQGLALAELSSTPEEQARGLVLLERACRVGRARACEVAGALHQRFDSPEQAADYYAEGCRLERDAACLALAELYHDETEPHDDERAAEIYAAYCRSDEPPGDATDARGRACRRAGVYHFDHDRISEGAELLERGCLRGDGPACRRLGEARLEGRGELEARPRLAFSLLRHGCRRGDGPACMSVAEMYRRGSPTVQSAKRAKDYAQEACRADHEPGCSFEVPAASTDGEETKPRISDEPPTVPTMPRSELQRVIKYHLPHLRYCYESRLKERSELAGKVMIDMEIGRDGEIHSLELLSNTLDDEEMTRCLDDEIRTWLFPQPPAGVVKVRYPLVFSQ